MLATNMAAREEQIVTHEIDQRFTRVHRLANRLAIHREHYLEAVGTHSLGSSSWPSTRFSNTPARCFFSFALA
jgi:hypothetical protein